MTERKPSRRGKRSAAADRQIDISGVLDAPVRYKQDGQIRSMPAYEATLRQHLRKALVNGSIASLKFLVARAKHHDIIKRPPPAPGRGGVFVVPKGLPDEVEREIFGPPSRPEEPMARIFDILWRYFDGRRQQSE
jgi:hypothetical protein